MTIFKVLVAILTIWTIPWKVYAVWTAVKLGHKRWFIALLLLNTLSALELIYVFYVLKKSKAEVKADFKAGWVFLKNGFKDKEVPKTE